MVRLEAGWNCPKQLESVSSHFLHPKPSASPTANLAYSFSILKTIWKIHVFTVQNGMADQLGSNYTEDERLKLFHPRYLVKFKNPS